MRRRRVSTVTPSAAGGFRARSEYTRVTAWVLPACSVQ
jgi:hypothetical protein